MDKYKEIEELLMKYSHLGYKEVEYEDGTGAKLIGEIPYHGNKIWLNRIYNPINNNEVIAIEDSIGKKLPYSLKKFLMEFSNGLTFMATTISIYGKRINNFGRKFIKWQPMHFMNANVYERLRNAPQDAVFIGYYEYDATNVFMTQDGRVHYCGRWDATTLHIWSFLEEFLISEIKRIYELYNDKGELIAPDSYTSPMIHLNLD